MKKGEIDTAIQDLKENLDEIGRVSEWSGKMGFDNPKKFSRKFVNYYGVRPQKILEFIRLDSIIQTLRSDENYLHIKIARIHSLPDEKCLNNFTNYHLGYSPTELKIMSDNKVNHLMEKLWSKIMEEYQAEKIWNDNYRKVS